MNRPSRRQHQTPVSYPNSPFQDWLPFEPQKKVDSRKKFRCLLKQAETFGNPKAQWIVGVNYFLGVGVNENKTAAIYWLEQSATKGNKEAQLFLGFIYLTYFQEETKAFNWFLKAADDHKSKKATGPKNKLAQFMVGGLYSKGLGVTKNSEEAIKWWEKAAALSV